MEKFVFADCWELLQRFGSLANTAQQANFELFCQCWSKLQMQHFYSAQTNNVEVIETTLAALHVAKRVACARRTNGEPFQATRAQRIGGIYLLYAIYNKQPTMHFVKIKVSPSTWETLSRFVEQLRLDSGEQNDTQQVSYIFWQLVQKNAFRFTALDYCQALDALADYDHLESYVDTKQSKNQTKHILPNQLRPTNANLVDEIQGLTELSTTCKPLCQLETAYNQHKAEHHTELPATTIFSQLQAVFSDINKMLTDERSTSSHTTNNQLDQRKSLRHRAMYGDIEKAEPETSVAEPSEPHERRMSSSTVFGRKLPDDVLKDLGS
ncbi:Pbp45 [Drosophila busckii]|uniref:Pbp45 n=1 Tax=Drosophila busckii TaxID=30019 RepID=A0A0M4EDU4_DROBS|nr:snRNA-activating protein complex subunit 1 [Drosophila busckii]ALC42127.1 Pbp45 [Drosophila busckii]